MSIRFFTPDLSDKRIEFAAKSLQDMGYINTDSEDKADFVLLGVNPAGTLLKHDIPCFAGNVSANNIYDYTKNEMFALKNAYLTAEGALSLAIEGSSKSLINSRILITGYGRIAKALHKYLAPFTNDITVCARSIDAQTLAQMNGAKAVNFDSLQDKSEYDFIFSTVPHPVFNETELAAIKKDAVIIDLASFPGGVDVHFAKHFGLNLIVARGLPAKYSPESAGKVVAQTVDTMVREVFV